MDSHFDLIVIGAGPGGSNAAAVALRSGLRVAQLERHRFPRSKPCAGGLTPRALEALAFELDPSRWRSFEAIELSLRGEQRCRFTHREPLLHTVLRPAFDNELVERNRERAGFELFEGEPVREIQHDGRAFRVRTEQRVLHAPQLVGADGANGLVNRVFRIARPKARAIAVEVNLGTDRARLERPTPPCFDFGVVPSGYAWVFPKRDGWSVGIYTLARGLGELRERLVAYLRDKGFVIAGDPLESFEAHPVPVGGHRLAVPRVPVYVVGDAGGFADALTGEGIYQALESGRLAGLVASDRARGIGTHRRYYRRLWRKVLCDTMLSYQLSRHFYAHLPRMLRMLRKRLVWAPLLQGYARGAGLSGCLALGAAYLLESSLRGTPALQTDALQEARERAASP